MQTSTRGGRSDSDAKEDTVIAATPRGPRAVTTVTPLAQSLSVSRKCCAPIANRVPLPLRERIPAGEITLGACPSIPMDRAHGAWGPNTRPRGTMIRGARIESLFLAGPAGRLEAVLKHPPAPAAAPGDGATPAGPPAVAVVCHPHPMFGGTMHNKVVHAAAEALARRGLPTLRFNFRGVGRSAGRHDHARGE